jgi:HlyD family secretion protein
VAKKQNIEIHNEDVREIMKEIPGSLIRWGLTIIFLIFASVIVGSYFFKFKEVVSAPLIITTTNPPAPIICKVSGRINKWFLSDGELVKKGDYIALINNSTNITDFKIARKLIRNIDPNNIQNCIQTIYIPENLELGEIQELYNQFYKNWKNYKGFLDKKYISRKIELLKQQIEKQEQQYLLSVKQKQMIEKELEIAKTGLSRYKNLLKKGGVSESQLEEAKARVIQSERSYINFLSSIKGAEINRINQKRSLLELQEQNDKQIEQFETEISGNIKSLKNQLKNWEDKYLIISPIDGRLTLTKYWSENHVVTAGERLATIVPSDSSLIICRAVISSSGIGKVEEGQQVQIKLAGYPSMEHGTLKGMVNSKSLIPEKEGYIVEISVTNGMISNYSEKLKLIQEMDGTADIITNEMRMIFRFINPLKMLVNK